MAERLLIAAALVACGLLAYQLFAAWHRGRATRARAADITLAADIPLAADITLAADIPPAAETASAAPPAAAVLYFRSDHCAPCLTQARFLDQLAAEFGARVTVQKIDADREREAADRYGIFTVPTTLVIDGTGTVRHANYGLADTRQLTAQIQPLLGA
jgi:thiol-disulfide isomerase/thioredoxin